jgi:hypothetical protein
VKPSSEQTIAHLPEQIASLSPDIRTLAHRIFHIERVHGRTVSPPAMHGWIADHFGELEAVQNQTIVKITNRFTLESATFNPLRARRPHDDTIQSFSASPDPDEVLEQLLDEYRGANDTFHDPVHGTPADTFGRIRGAYCLSASNVAKYDEKHGLVIFDEFHPLRFNQAQLNDYFSVALRWLFAAHHDTPDACYPVITWNCLWKSGASITHGHMQMVLSRGMAFGHVERQRRALVEYRSRYHRSLSDDMWHVHDALNLSFAHQHTVRGYVSLTPVKDHEVVLVSTMPAGRELWGQVQAMGADADASGLDAVAQLEPLWQATWVALRNLIDVQGVRSFNLVVSFPPLADVAEPWDDMPVWVRMVDRGPPLSRMVNFGAMEIFAGSVISADPFLVAAKLRSS